MAEAAVEFVLGKLANMILKEAQLLGGVGDQVKQVQRELTWIRCCLKDADSKRKGDASVQNWLNELRDVAYRIEDVTDTFFVQVEDNHKPKNVVDAYLHKINKICHVPHEMRMPVLLHKLGTELEKIQKDLDGIYKSRVNFGIEYLQEQDKGEENEVTLPFRRYLTYQDMDETEVVGLEADRNDILKLLLHSEETPRRAVITIVGTGGLGKTTLANMVYKSAKENFEYHIMLSISQKFSRSDLLTKMLIKLKYSVPKKQEMGKLIKELRSLLSSRKYLIILDDVWEVDLWNQLKDALPDVRNGSRILMTSRFIDVAKSADPMMKPYELDFLNDEDSLDLLLKKAFPRQEPAADIKCPDELREPAVALSKKCKGLPLALIVVGGILSTKDQAYSSWQRVLETMDWHSEGKDCMNVLAMSYEDMPYYLKACFLYLASFPEDYEISAKRLIRMWVAERFVTQQGRKTMEEIAEDRLEELFQRCMIQVSNRHTNGLIKNCRVHDLLRDLAMHQAEEENFITVYSKPEDVKQPNREIRRASFQSNHNKFMKYLGPNTRSLLWFTEQIPWYSEFRLLKVLEIEGVRAETELRGLDRLIHLKYLGIRDCNNIKIQHCSFSHLKNLETLDLRGTRFVPPQALWTISTLRHVLADKHSCLSGPKTTDHLPNLQTLKWVLVLGTSDRNWPCLNSLRKIGLCYQGFDWLDKHPPHDWGVATGILGKVPSLVSLQIRGNSIPKVIVYPRALPNYQNLQSLYLEGDWSEGVTFKASSFPPYLSKLTIITSCICEDLMPELGKLKSLRKLCLRASKYNGDQMICPAGFPVIQHLKVLIRWLNFEIAEGVMPKLKYLETYYGCNLQMPPELRQVTVIFNR